MVTVVYSRVGDKYVVRIADEDGEVVYEDISLEMCSRVVSNVIRKKFSGKPKLG